MAQYMERPGYIPPQAEAEQPLYNEKDVDAAIANIITPEDSFINGVYWADLPFGQRVKWILKSESRERGYETRQFWTMTKGDPLAPLGYYWKKFCVTGMGLFVESYTIFSIGNLTSLFSYVWPTCWSTYRVCDKTWVAAVTYLEIVGIIIGQITVGIEADYVGRRFGSIQDGTLLTLGTIMLIASWGTSLNGWVICYAWSLFVYAVGVGGEYPITGTRALEQDGTGFAAQRNDRLHRGRSLVLAFLMQGWGQLANQVVLILLLVILNGNHGNPSYSETATQWTFRLSFAFILFFTVYLLYLRIWKVKSFDTVLLQAKRQGAVTGYDSESAKLAITHYGGRLLATAGGWFASDFFFYGSKLFQSNFIKVIDPGATVMTGWLYNLINIGVSLVGYYMAAWLIDSKLYGRVHMQGVGFFFMFLCFIIPAADYAPIQTPGGIHVFQWLYYMSSFFTQFGPNCVTFLVAAECFPTAIRGSAHGISAASGKLGALVPAILYNYIPTETRFWVVPWFGVLGFALTYIFLPDMTGLDLKEQERYWQYVRNGNPQDYHGLAVHPRHLSFWEHRVLKRSRYYDPVADHEMKMKELRAMYDKVAAARNRELTHPDEELDDSDASFISREVEQYFASRKGTNGVANGEKHVPKLEESGKTRS